MPSQTDTQRQAAAQKAAATRRENAAKRSGSARKAAETRAKAQMNRLEAAGLQAQRAGDVALGAAISTGESIADAVRPLSDPSREWKRLQGSTTTAAKKAERRGARVRKGAQRKLQRRSDQVRRTVQERARSLS